MLGLSQNTHAQASKSTQTTNNQNQNCSSGHINASAVVIPTPWGPLAVGNVEAAGTVCSPAGSSGATGTGGSNNGGNKTVAGSATRIKRDRD